MPSNSINSGSYVTDEELVASAQKDDQNAIEEILLRYRPFVRSLASHYLSASLETDDIAQEGFIGLLSAVYTYSPKKNAAFKTYCAVCVNNAIRSAVKADGRLKHSPLNKHIPIEDIDITASYSVEQAFISEENTVFLKNVIAEKLSFLEKKILELHMNGSDYKTIAQQLDITEKAVDNALQRARKKLLQALKEN